MSVWTDHYDAIYAALGIEAELRIGTVEYDLTVVDKTEGIDIEAAGLNMPTIKAGACIRMSELKELDITREALRGATLEYGDYTWRVARTKSRPSPEGKETGEVLLLLEEPA